ncbi:MAG: DUF4830 domain-containing protein [Ruminococcaceae bacterium]|nr:DUF4830 domain-containing protein [Oscillospiraceae bacterium]
MFIFTTKVNKKKLLTGAVFVLAIIVIIIAVSSMSKEAWSSSELTSVVKTNEERVLFLTSLGWEVSEEPIEEQVITIPKEFDDVYTQYNEIQLSQGFDLTEYAGLEATRYTYEVKNHPDTTGKVVADIIVYRNRIIAGDIQSTVMDGFMSGLDFPDSANENS